MYKTSETSKMSLRYLVQNTKVNFKLLV